MTLTFGSLFAGIGGFDLGFERAGMQCKWQVEIDPYCQRVLAKHWPDVRRWDDVRTFLADIGWRLEEWIVDVICGGFPCQDISTANANGAGIDGDRSGLWSEYFRVIRTLRPRFAVVENVANLLKRGLGRVLGDLASIGYDAEWACIPACSFGAPHIRERVFVLAYPAERGTQVLPARPQRSWPRASDITRRGEAASLRNTCDTECWRLEGGLLRQCAPPPKIASAGRGTSLGTYLGEAWPTEPREGWLDDGLSGQLAEFSSRAFGNSVLPQVAEWIGRRIVESYQEPVT